MCEVREIPNSSSKSVDSGIFFLARHQVWERVNSLAKVMLFQKTYSKELDCWHYWQRS